MTHILFILSGNISTTPRAVKNILTASRYHQVTVLKANRHPAWDVLDGRWQKQHPMPVHSVYLGRRPFIPWLWGTLWHKLAQWLYPVFSQDTRINALSSQKVNSLLIQASRKLSPKADFVIGQGGGALYPAYWYARRRGIPFAFDVEDYHPGEKMDAPKGYEKKRRTYLLQSILPHAAFVSYASPLIGEYTLQQLSTPPKKHFLLNNAFPAAEFIPPNPPQSSKLHLVWFSQNIDFGRGLEQLITAAIPYQSRLEITLIGHARVLFHKQWIAPHKHFVHCREPLPQEQLHRHLSRYDVGLALEISDTDINKDIAISNKLFAYAQAGLYILATNTRGQEQFLHQYPQLGEVCGQDTSSLEQAVNSLLQQQNKIRQKAHSRYQFAQKLAWEHEAPKFLHMLDEALHSPKAENQKY